MHNKTPWVGYKISQYKNHGLQYEESSYTCPKACGRIAVLLLAALASLFGRKTWVIMDSLGLISNRKVIGTGSPASLAALNAELKT